MNKISYLLIIATLIYSCTSKFDELEFSENFKDLNFEYVETEKISTEDYCEDFLINSDNTFSKQVDYCIIPSTFYIGNWYEITDSTKFTAIDIKNYNFFLDCKLKLANNNQDKNEIEIIDKTGHPINNFPIQFINVNDSFEQRTTNGLIKFNSDKFDSIYFTSL